MSHHNKYYRETESCRPLRYILLVPLGLYRPCKEKRCYFSGTEENTSVTMAAKHASVFECKNRITIFGRLISRLPVSGAFYPIGYFVQNIFYTVRNFSLSNLLKRCFSSNDSMQFVRGRQILPFFERVRFKRFTFRLRNREDRFLTEQKKINARTGQRKTHTTT